MPQLPECVALIRDGVVENVAALSTENDYTAWLDAMRDEYDDVLIVLHAGIGWLVTPDGLRAPKPDEDTTWVWDDANGWWDRPVPYPTDGGTYEWDEDAQDWTPVPAV